MCMNVFLCVPLWIFANGFFVYGFFYVLVNIVANVVVQHRIKQHDKKRKRESEQKKGDAQRKPSVRSAAHNHFYLTKTRNKFVLSEMKRTKQKNCILLAGRFKIDWYRLCIYFTVAALFIFGRLPIKYTRTTEKPKSRANTTTTTYQCEQIVK